MTWVRVDDSAFEHPKLLTVGAKAAWLWLCCLSYANRQKRHDGVVPKTKIGLLYPGLGLKEAKDLVRAKLLHDAGDHFQIHDFHDYQPSADLSGKRSLAGKQGGIKSGEARRSKTEANAKQTLEARNEAPARYIPVHPDPDPVVVAGSGSDRLPDPQAGAVPPPPRAVRKLSGSRLDQLKARIVDRERKPGQPPEPRHDPMGERFAVADWWPSVAILASARERGLTDSEVDATLIEARDKLTGLHEIGWFDVKIERFVLVAIERKRRPPGQIEHERFASRPRGTVAASDRKFGPETLQAFGPELCRRMGWTG